MPIDSVSRRVFLQAAAAIAASRQGMRVVVSDGETAPIDKPCGEGLMPDSRLLAARLGMEISESMGYEFRGIRFHGAGRAVAADFSAGCGIGIRRKNLKKGSSGLNGIHC